MDRNDPISARRDAETIGTSERVDDRPLLRVGGEFRSRALEAAFGLARFDETIRHGRWLLIASVILNSLFFLSDWRFHGTAQFWVAIPARSVVVLASLLCLLLLGRCRTPLGARRVMAGWVATTALSVTLLVTSHSELALFVVLLLPMIFYLGVPMPFLWTVAGGVGASAMLLIGYEAPAPSADSGLGLAIALATLNCCLALVVARSNRLERLEWQATRAAHAFADELAASRETLEKMFAAAPVPMVVSAVEDGRILRVNDACAAMFGVSPEMVGVETVHRFYADLEERGQLMAALARDGRVNDFEARAIGADGKLRTMLVKAALVDLAAGQTVMAGLIDISDRKAVELSLEWLASTDPLTRLPNRLSFFSTARGEVMRSRRLGRPLALLMIDLDHFKTINDDFGHHAGDQALKAFGALCLARLRGGDIVGRLGGEEFGVLLPDTDQAEALAIAEDLCRELAALRLPPPNQSLRLSASIGLTLVRPDDGDLDAALARADRALYAAKHGGRDRVHFDFAEDVEPGLVAAR